MLDARPVIHVIGLVVFALGAAMALPLAVDLIVGNDFDVPDFYYRGDGKGGFQRVVKNDGIIPHLRY